VYQKSTVIVNPSGLHARPASEFIAVAKKFSSGIRVWKAGEENKKSNAKSIISLLSLALKKGTPVVIEASGDDEKEAVDSLVAAINSGLGEQQ